jgi:hypothetical protein
MSDAWNSSKQISRWRLCDAAGHLVQWIGHAP